MARQTFYFSDGPYLQVMQGLYAALSGPEALVKFIGQSRTGKSGVCEKLTQFMRLKDYRVIYFDYPIESPDMLRSLLAKELDMPDTVNILRHLEDALAAEAEKPLILIFDDAHLLSDISLIEIYRLAGVQVGQKRVIHIVLCGEPELERRLSRKKEFNSLLQHVSHNFLLEPMNAVTTSQFLSAYLVKMELAGLQLEPAALTQFYKSCKGFPGPAYSLCQLILASRQGSKDLSPITKQELLLAINNADNEQPLSSSMFREGNRWMLLGPIGAVILIVVLTLLVRLLSSPESRSDTEEFANLVVDNEETVSAASPFAIDQVQVAAVDDALPVDDSAQTDALKAEQATAEEELPVSDSALALVTAQERGISSETIAEPLFEQMMSSNNAEQNHIELKLSATDESESGGEATPVVDIALTRPMLALDDEEIEVVMKKTVEASAVESVLVPAEDLAAVAAQASEQIEVSEQSDMSPQQVVQNWLDAWEGQDLEQYFASYDDGFIPRYHRSRSAWKSNRERVIGNANQINLEMSDFVLVSEDAESVEVHFWLAYTSPSYKDDTRKKLILKKLPIGDQAGVRLLILEEINLEVRV